MQALLYLFIREINLAVSFKEKKKTTFQSKRRVPFTLSKTHTLVFVAIVDANHFSITVPSTKYS